MFNDQVRKVIGKKQYARNLLYTVWDVLYKRKFALLKMNCTENRIMNLKILNQADAVVSPKQKKPKVITEVSDDLAVDYDSCLVCGDHGFLVECNKCLKSAHPDCVGITNSIAKSLAFWYCPVCITTVPMTLPLLVDARPPVTEATENNAL